MKYNLMCLLKDAGHLKLPVNQTGINAEIKFDRRMAFIDISCFFYVH